MYSNNHTLSRPIRLAPTYRDYIWGGSRLIPGKDPVAEAWVLYEHDRITAPADLAGKTLAELAQEFPTELLGTRAVQRTGHRFPLLVKLLDCAQWLSLQVHPDDAHARQLEGAGQFGKSEAWHFIEADPGAEIICGLQPGLTRQEFEERLRGGILTEITRRLYVKSGESIFISPGTIHALGPGLFLYEVQQTSDLTYRVYDWDRPPTPARPLHIEKSLAVSDLKSAPHLISPPSRRDIARTTLLKSDYFILDYLQSQPNPIQMETDGQSFHAITVTAGSMQVSGEGWTETLTALDTLLLPACTGAYRLTTMDEFTALLASVPD